MPDLQKQLLVAPGVGGKARKGLPIPIGAVAAFWERVGNDNMDIREIYIILTQELKGMSASQHFWYWIFPIALLSLLMAFFFSGIPILVEMINPAMNKEWGLLENIQLVIVAVMIGVSAYAFCTKKPALQKWGFGFITVFAVFVFLEEIDYGAHISHYFTGDIQSQLGRLTGVYNIHNRGEWTAAIIKRSVYALMLLIFVIAPLLKRYFRNDVISYLIPKPKIIIIAVSTIMVELIARALVPLNNLKLDDLTMDIGEFSEIMVYYVFLMYLIQLIFEKDWVITSQANTEKAL